MAIVEVQNLNLAYGDFPALKNVNVHMEKNTITALIGPSGCGKSTFLRALNRMNDLIEGVKTTGNILIDKEDILDAKTDLVSLRKKVGMVFQRPNPFPLTIMENILFAPKIHQTAQKAEYAVIVEECLRAVLLWDVLKDKLHKNALQLSLEQQQRLCIARLLAVKPEILLMDEPCSALDPIATERIEELMWMLKANYTIVIVTHNMQQAARVSEHTGFMLLGELIEFGRTKDIFTYPQDQRTNDYITGRFG
ncbi:MAG: phosphate ABC transporter ATP-binding protein [Omnitrophica WOR_2 bacterium RIFCSPHIGHO2_01_FULL_48_9]|nr:MAG: phosphate ABC transporter ATP-binding protein [Omnitrophica WOR_2 bacterium RIFCSPHIGHO2_02_FULL_48_11]OGX31069.1 MAG: phosphate ABC transporter ATP-binding protein [Omnitrophica WOR_2 bacterium RIFCSPHIGHO2_01_FULL_48_9]